MFYKKNGAEYYIGDPTDNSRRDFVVILKDEQHLEEFYQQMESQNGKKEIPDRSVECLDRRPDSRGTAYSLTNAEALALAKHHRVEHVCINVETHPHINKELHSWQQQSNQFSRKTFGNSNHFNWGLMRSNLRSGYRAAYDGSKMMTILSEYSGKNVDVVIADDNFSNEQVAEFRQNSDGTGYTRLTQYNWLGKEPIPLAQDYNQYDGTHGTHTTGTVAGNQQGWARDSNIYQIDFTMPNVFQKVKNFHLNKPINPITGQRNPTIMNNSWGYGRGFPFNLLGIYDYIMFRGSRINPTGSFPNYIYTTAQLNQARIPFVVNPNGSIVLYGQLPATDVATNADALDAIAAGVIIVASAGNDSFYTASGPGDPDYNNYMHHPSFSYYGGYVPEESYYYHRGSSPANAGSGGDNKVISVGALGASTEDKSPISSLYTPGSSISRYWATASTEIDQADIKSEFSNYGPGVTVYAPGAGIQSSSVTEIGFYRYFYGLSYGGSSIHLSGIGKISSELDEIAPDNRNPGMVFGQSNVTTRFTTINTDLHDTSVSTVANWKYLTANIDIDQTTLRDWARKYTVGRGTTIRQFHAQHNYNPYGHWTNVSVSNSSIGNNGIKPMDIYAFDVADNYADPNSMYSDSYITDNVVKLKTNTQLAYNNVDVYSEYPQPVTFNNNSRFVVDWGRLEKNCGTSMAGPQVAGVLACIAEKNPRMTQTDAIAYIFNYCPSDLGQTNGGSGDFNDAGMTFNSSSTRKILFLRGTRVNAIPNNGNVNAYYSQVYPSYGSATRKNWIKPSLKTHWPRTGVLANRTPMKMALSVDNSNVTVSGNSVQKCYAARFTTNGVVNGINNGGGSASGSTPLDNATPWFCEFWIKFDTVPVIKINNGGDLLAGTPIINSTGLNQGIKLYLGNDPDNGNKPAYLIQIPGVIYSVFKTDIVLDTNNFETDHWYHICLKNRGLYNIYYGYGNHAEIIINGHNNPNENYFATAMPRFVAIGNQIGNFDGWITDFRIGYDESIYANDVSQDNYQAGEIIVYKGFGTAIPVPQSPLVALPGPTVDAISILTFNKNTIIDSSHNAVALTVFGTVIVENIDGPYQNTPAPITVTLTTQGVTLGTKIPYIISGVPTYNPDLGGYMTHRFTKNDVDVDIMGNFVVGSNGTATLVINPVWINYYDGKWQLINIRINTFPDSNFAIDPSNPAFDVTVRINY